MKPSTSSVLLTSTSLKLVFQVPSNKINQSDLKLIELPSQNVLNLTSVYKQMLNQSRRKDRTQNCSRERSRNDKKDTTKSTRGGTKEKTIEENPYLYQPMNYRKNKTNRQLDREKSKSSKLPQTQSNNEVELSNTRKSGRVKKSKFDDQNKQLNLKMLEQTQRNLTKKDEKSESSISIQKKERKISLFNNSNSQNLENLSKFLGRFYATLHLPKEQIVSDINALKKKSLSKPRRNTMSVEDLDQKVENQ